MNAPARRFSLSLILLHAFLSLGALGGGLMFIIDPSGELMGLPRTLLDTSPFGSYLVPGIILLGALGILPAITAVALFSQRQWQAAQRLNVFKDMHWSWTFSLYIGFILILWIVGQVALIRELSVLQLIFILLGVLIQIVTLAPRTQRRYTRVAPVVTGATGR